MEPTAEINGEIVLHGFVGDNFLDEGFTSKQLLAALADKGDVTVRLNSGGGFATDGAAMYAMLKSHGGNVKIIVEGVAASAASVIAMAGDEIVMSDGAMMMIHEPSSMTWGDAEDHQKSAAMLDKLAENSAEIYAKRTGQDAEKIRQMMIAETWLTADEAVEMGFADSTGEDAKAVSAFDFNVYANAPKDLRELAKAKGWRFADQRDAHSHKEATMSTKEAATDIAAQKTEKVEQKKPEAPVMKAEDIAKATQKAVADERQRASEIRKAVQAASLPAEFADEMIDDGVPVDEARAKIIQKWADAGDRTEVSPRRTQDVMVLRDEMETRAAGMEAALTAQISMTAPEDDRAAPFMGMSVVEMAASHINHSGSIRRTADRERVLNQAFMMSGGMHTTSDFAAIFENSLNKSLAAQYQLAEPTYRQIARQISFKDFRPHPMVKPGDFPTLQPVNEAGEIKYGTFGEKKESVAVAPYAVAVGVSRQMLVNDEMGAINEVINSRGNAVAEFEDTTFYAMMLGGTGSDGPTLLETSRQVFNTTDGTKAGSGTAITVASLGAGRAAMRKQTSLDGQKLNIAPSILLVGPDKETEAQQIVAPIQAQQAGNVNPFSGVMSVVATAEITGNAWYLFANPTLRPNFIWGLLEGYEAPRFRTETPFGQQGVQLSLEHDFGVGAVDYRFGYKNSGA